MQKVIPRARGTGNRLLRWRLFVHPFWGIIGLALWNGEVWLRNVSVGSTGQRYLWKADTIT